jgi:phenylpyruvate tautomerase PptA (4-oxalocrotonate tautomerase family)
MPLVRISLRKGKTAEFRRKLGDAIHRALVETIDVPELDRFQVLSEHEPGDLVYDPGYLGIARIADNLADLGLRREDAWINLVEVAKENWSFGLGEASYAPPEKVPA